MSLKSFIVLIILIILISIGIQFTLYNENLISYLFVIPGFLFGFVISVIIHELGHLVFGLLSGYKFVSFKVLFVKIYKKDKIRITLESGFLSVPGQCLMKPTNRNYLMYNLGGLIFTYLLTVFSLILCYKLRNDYFIQFIFGLLLVNTVLGVMNSIYSKEGINDICNIVHCMKNKDYLEAVLYQLDIVSNITINDKFKSRYNPSDDVDNTITNLTLYRFKYFKAYNEKNIDKMNYYYKLISRNYSSINIMMLKIPLLILLLNHEFLIKKDISLIKKRCRRINKTDMLYIKKLKDEYNLILFYKMNVCDKITLDTNLFEGFIISNPTDLIEKLNNKMYEKIYRVYLAYVRNDYVLN